MNWFCRNSVHPWFGTSKSCKRRFLILVWRKLCFMQTRLCSAWICSKIKLLLMLEVNIWSCPKLSRSVLQIPTGNNSLRCSKEQVSKEDIFPDAWDWTWYVLHGKQKACHSTTKFWPFPSGNHWTDKKCQSRQWKKRRANTNSRFTYVILNHGSAWCPHNVN